MEWILLLAAMASPWEVDTQDRSGVRVATQHVAMGSANADALTWRRLEVEGLVYGARPKSYFVRVNDVEHLAALRKLGARGAVGTWVPVQLDPAQLHGLMHAGGFELERATAHRTSLELSAQDIGADRVLLGYVGNTSRSGAGVVVGVIDTGVDLTHPAFSDATGRSRVIAVWDQDATGGKPPSGFGYGAACGGESIRAGACPLSDHQGHGTHVAGIAAGNRVLGGIAPDAEIVVVASDTFTRIADAVRYIVEVAENRGMPAVINLSVGGHYGPHDGKTPLERYLDGYLGEGRVLVAAAGNDGNDTLHAEIRLDDRAKRLAIEGVRFGKPTETLAEFWSTRGTVLDAALELWMDDDVVGELPLDVAEGDLVEHTVTLSDGCEIGVGFSMRWHAVHHLRQRTLVIDGSQCPEAIEGLELVFKASGVGRLQAWVGQSDYSYGFARFGEGKGAGWVSGDQRHSITVPATAASVITVGAYAVRNAWISEAGDEQTLSLGAGALAPYSSWGPTTDARRTGLKPLISAPGSVVASARSLWVPSSTATLDVDRMVMQGTSMAAPHVTGAIALMLEVQPDLEPRQISTILAETARLDEHTGPDASVRWGFGKLDAELAVDQAELGGGGCSQAPSGSLWGLLALLLAAKFAATRRRCIKDA
jgi:subtilisin family serine protease